MPSPSRAVTGLMAFLLATSGWASNPDTNLFDKVYTMHMRDKNSKLHDGPPIECVPATLEGCNEREADFARKVRSFNATVLKKMSNTIVEEERAAFQKGRPLSGDAERWMFERKSILYHLQDDLKAAEHAAARKAWESRHDEL